MIRICVKFRLVLFVLAALAILWLSVMPNPPVPKTGMLSWDKVQHALGYAFLAAVGGWALLPLVPSPVRAWRYALAIAVGYGALMEGIQAWFTPSRRGDVGDIVANGLGGLAIYGLARLISGRLFKQHRKEG